MKNDLQHQLDLHIEYGIPHPPFQDEHIFYELVAKGDLEAIKQLKQQHKDTSDEKNPTERGKLSDNPLRDAIYHLVVNCTIITRCCITAGMPQEQAYTLSDLFIRRADRCKTVSEVETLNDELDMEFASRMKKLHENPVVSPAVRKAVRYICNHLGEKLTAENIAEKIGYNRSYLSILFKKETGTAISQFILTKRIETARSMIENDVPFSEIAETLGFSSQSHFCARFRCVTGMSPKEYKNRQSFTDKRFI